MARVGINTGSTANDGTGDSLRAAGGIINSNFSEIYSQLGDGTNLSATWEKTSAGINSTANVGIGTTNPQFQLEVGYAGVADTSLFVHGNARVTGILTVGASSIVIDGSKNEVLIGTGVSLNGATGIISATQVYAGGTLLTGGSGGSADSFWVEEGSTGITTTKNVGVATDSAPSALTVGGQSLFLGITTFRENVILSNPNSGASNNLNFGGDVYIDQSSGDTFTFQINTGSDTNTTDGSFVFRNTEPNTDPIPDFQLDALRIYTRGDYWNGMVRSYTDFHADQNAFVGGDLQVGAASTLIGAGNTLGSFKVGAGGTVISTSASGLVGIGSSVPSVELDVSGNVSVSSSVTAASFHGDGSKLTGIVASGTGVIVKDGGSLVGTAGTIDFADNISVSTLSGAAVTITVSAASTADVRTNTFAASGVSTFSGNVDLGDNDRLRFGTDADGVEIYHDGSNSYILNDGVGSLLVNTDDFFVKSSDNSQSMLRAGTTDVELYYGGSEKLATVDNGVNVTGVTITDHITVSGVSTLTGHVALSTSLNVAGIVTAEDGLRIPGGTGTSNRIELGNSQEFTLQYNTASTRGLISAAGNSIDIQATTIKLLPNVGENGVIVNQNGTVELYYDNSKKFETSGAGVTVTGTVISDQLSVSGITSLGTDGGARFIEIDNDAITFKSSDNSAAIRGDGQGGLSISPGDATDSVTIGTYAIFKSNGNVTLNNGGQGSTQVMGPLDMREDFYNTVGVTSVAQLRTTSLQASGISTLTGHVALSTSLTVAGISTFDINTGQSVEFRDTSNNGHVAINMASSYEPQIQFISHDNDIASISGDSNANMVIAAGTTLNLRANTSDTVLQAAGNNTDIYAYNAKKLAVTSSGIEVAGIVTAISGIVTYYGDGSQLSNIGVAATGDVRTNTFAASGVSTFSNNVTVDGGDITFTSQGDKLIFTADAANPASGGAIEISTSGSGTAEISGNSNQLRIYNQQDANHSIAMRAGEYYIQDESADYYALFSSGVAKLYHPDSAGGISEQKFETNSKGVAVAGIVTAISGVSTFYGDVSKASAGRWYLGAGAGNTSYFFTGIGFTSVDYAHNPVIHLARGQRYEFVNEMNAHGFQIQSGSVGGDPYDPGVTNNGSQNGTIAIEVPFNAPNELFYQCTSHSGMGGTFTIYPSI